MDQGQEKKKKVKLPINRVLITVGLLFFINPNVSVYDVLPDVIGALLILCGFLRFAEIDERAKRAQKLLSVLALVDAGKTLTPLLLTQSEGTVWSLTFTFAFGAAEAALFACGMLKLYAAITYRAQRLDCPALLRGFNALGPLTILVAILKNLLAILPELTKLSGDFGSVVLGSSGGVEVAHFIYTALTILNIAVVTLYGVGWFVYTARYLKTLGAQRDFLENLRAQYEEEVGSKPQVLTYRALKTARILLFVALIFLLPLHLDGVDYLPDYIAGLLFALALLRLRALYPKPVRAALIPCALYTLFAAVEWTGELIVRAQLNAVDYQSGYYQSVSMILLRHPDKLTGYFVVIGAGVLKYLALAVFLFFFLRLFRPIVAEHTGAPYDLSSIEGQVRDARIKGKLRTLLAVLTGIAFLAAATGIVRRIFRMFNDLMIMEYIELLGVLPFAIVFLWFLSKLEEGIDNKYYLEK